MPNWTKSPDRPRRIGVLVFARFSNLCLAHCIEPLRAANTLAPHPVYEWQILTPDGNAVPSSSDLPVLGRDARGASGFDHVMVLASYDHTRLDTPATRALLRRLARGAAEMSGFDSAPWLMASAGLLDGRRATIHRDLLGPFAEAFPTTEVAPARVVRDGNRITCAGAFSALDHVFAMIRADAGEALTMDIEALFLRDDPLAADRPRPGDPLVRAATEAMRTHLAEPLTLSRLARLLRCQPRTLDRRFRAALGASPGMVYRHIRLSHARQLAEASNVPVGEIAARCGYDNAAALTRAFRRRYGAPPTALRTRHEI